jgi:hypothetical protein
MRFEYFELIGQEGVNFPGKKGHFSNRTKSWSKTFFVLVNLVISIEKIFQVV